MRFVLAVTASSFAASSVMETLSKMCFRAIAVTVDDGMLELDALTLAKIPVCDTVDGEVVTVNWKKVVLNKVLIDDI